MQHPVLEVRNRIAPTRRFVNDNHNSDIYHFTHRYIKSMSTPITYFHTPGSIAATRDATTAPFVSSSHCVRHSTKQNTIMVAIRQLVYIEYTF